MSRTPEARRWDDEERAEVREARRRQILREAGALFSEVGFHNASMEQIAARLGLTKTALYYYFSDKSEILMCCFALGRQVADEALAKANALRANGLERVARFVQWYVVGITSELGACATTLELRSAPPDEMPALLTRMRRLDRQLRELVQAGIADGSCAAVEPSLAINWIMGAMTLLPRWYRPNRRLGAEAVADEYANYVRRMLAPASPDASATLPTEPST